MNKNMNILKLLFYPFFFARKGLYEGISTLAHHITGKVLDVGCGSKPYEKLFKVDKYIGLEIDTPENRKMQKADFYYDGQTFPFKNAFFDSVITSEVFEHVFNPDEFIKEIFRVLKPGGKLLLTVPFLWDEHSQPVDYARYTSFGIKHVLEKNGFEIIKCEKSVSGIDVILQMLNCYIYKIAAKNRVTVYLGRFIIIPVNLIGFLITPFFPKNPDLYIDNIILAKKESK